MYKLGPVRGYIIRVGALVRYKVGDDPEITVKTADLVIAHERDLKQIYFVIIYVWSQLFRDVDHLIQRTAAIYRMLC